MGSRTSQASSSKAKSAAARLLPADFKGVRLDVEDEVSAVPILVNSAASMDFGAGVAAFGRVSKQRLQCSLTFSQHDLNSLHIRDSFD